MDQPYQPLFNRTYLKVVPWVVAIVIVLLTANSQKTPTSFATELEQDWAYLTIEKEIEQQLLLTYPLTPAYTEKQTQQHIALQTSFTKAANIYPSIALQWKDDRVTLSILIENQNDKAETPDIKKIINDLTDAAHSHYPTALQRAAAERYLTLKSLL